MKLFPTLAGLSAAALIPLTLVPASTAAESPPPLELVALSDVVRHKRYPGEPTPIAPSVSVVAGSSAFEVHYGRDSYLEPLQAIWKSPAGDVALDLPDRERPTKLPGFFHVVIKKAGGRVLLDRTIGFCPNSYEATRAVFGAPTRNPYPTYCGARNPWVLGTVLGLESGWATPVSSGSYRYDYARLADGTYDVSVEIAPRYATALGIPSESASVEYELRLSTYRESEHEHRRSTAAQPQAGPRPSERAEIAGELPDLRSLPAWQIRTTRTPRGDYVRFAANVWNAGPGPLVVDGYRRRGAEIMDAYQIFFDADGDEVGTKPTGELEYDHRDGHDHWHFRDFAAYRILDRQKQPVALSGKEAFCLAPTDEIDLRVPGAEWQPGSTGLSTACGGLSSISIREVLQAGWGDTYTQDRPGQAFNITDLPNGQYFIEVKANPSNRLSEVSTTNNVALRKIRLGGVPGARTVESLPYQGIDVR